MQYCYWDRSQVTPRAGGGWWSARLGANLQCRVEPERVINRNWAGLSDMLGGLPVRGLRGRKGWSFFLGLEILVLGKLCS